MEDQSRIAPAIVIHEPAAWTVKPPEAAVQMASPSSTAALVMIGAFLLAFVAFALATF